MDSKDFTYWLQGFFEISNEKTLNTKQVQIIKDHLALVFNKVTPDRTEDKSFGIDAQEEMRKLLLENDSWISDLDNPNLCSSEPSDSESDSNNAGCVTVQRFGLGKFNIKKPTVYC